MSTPENDFWISLTHGGLLLSPQVLAKQFADPLPPLPEAMIRRVERALTPVLASSTPAPDALATALDTLFEDLLELDRTRWRKGRDQVGPDWQRRLDSGELVQPTRVWLGSFGETIPVFVLPREGRVLGLGASRRKLSQVLGWSRRTNQPLVVVTNGSELRLYYIGSDWEAFCEWSFDRLFEHGAPGPQLEALRRLLSRRALTAPTHGERPFVAQAILDSKKGHAELSAELGERVRQAVEALAKAFGPELRQAIDSGAFTSGDAYIAASRIIMRLVVIFFAEARGLLPVGHPVYADAYGLQSLRLQLGRLQPERLRQRHQAWARLLGLFQLVHDGSEHEALPVTAYGGGLFAPGKADASDAITRAVAFFEAPAHAPNDFIVQGLLERIATTKVKIRQGRTNASIITPVDFAGLETEYIGILYQGLLDYELRRAPDNDPIVFLQIASTPALPFSRVNGMNQDELKKLFEAFAKAEKLESEDDSEASEDEPEPETPSDDATDAEEAGEAVDDDEATDSDSDRAADLRVYVQEWAERTVKAAGLVKPPKRTKGPAPKMFDDYNAQVTRTARRLYQIVAPGEWYLVRWGGTRKGSGTFYTRPQLAAPTVMRTLRPLAFTSTTTTTSPRGVVLEDGWVPKPPDQILRLKVCDPACGSGAFLISALRFLTDALVQSLHHHGRIAVDTNDASQTRYRLADGAPAEAPWDEGLPVPPDHPDFDARLRARLKRHVVEQCIYGVDLDPLAIELARLALWIETLDRELPFGFLDHKVRAGNALIGAWLDRFQDYPLAAWERKAGDEDHERFVHHQRTVTLSSGKKRGQTETRGDPWSAALKERRAEIHSELAEWLTGNLLSGGTALVPANVHARAAQQFRALHRLPVNAPAQVKAGYDALRADADVRALERAMDAWCALWFWPGDALAEAPGPNAFATGAWSDATTAMIVRIAERQRFFHWEIAFPDVFTAERKGFDAVVGNPPWEIQKPNSKEFFSAIDPLYRSYGKQEALTHQEQIFERDAADEEAWIAYAADIKARSNWVAHAAFPFGDNPDDPLRIGSGRGRGPGSASDLQATWAKRRANRKGYADARHPYRHQGSADLNTYKMFLEQAHALLGDGGRLGLIVPSGVYTDKGATDLRRLFLEQCQWQWLFSFENRDAIFDIHRSFKFGPVIVEKPRDANSAASGTSALKVAFMRRRLDDWEQAEQHVLDYPRARVEQFSPTSRAILEIQDPKDLAVLTKLYTNGVLLGDKTDKGWGIKYATEFHMTNDSKLFPPRPKWEEQGYRPDEYGHWLKGAWHPIADFGWKPTHRKDPQYGHWLILDRPKDVVLSRDGTQALNLSEVQGVALPLYQGVMMHQLDPAFRASTFTGTKVKWSEQYAERKSVTPQFLISPIHCYLRSVLERCAFRDIGRTTDTRTTISALIPGFPSGNKLPILDTEPSRPGLLSAILNSFCFDWVERVRQGAATLNFYILEEQPILHPRTAERLELAVLSLASTMTVMARGWRSGLRSKLSWRASWAVAPAERLRLRCIVDACVAAFYGLSADDLKHILQDTDWPTHNLRDSNATREFAPKGFWRTDKAVPPELRSTILTQVAFEDLTRLGINAFLAQNSNEGWQLPETLRLSDYGLGHDARAKQPQKVASELGPRFYDWQLTQDVAESWEECDAHATLIESILQAGGAPIPSADAPSTETSTVTDSKGQTTFAFAPPAQPDLFNASLPGTRGRR